MSMDPAVGLLATQLDEAYGYVRARVEGLTQEESSWEPVDACWTVFRLPDGRWSYNYELPEPKPAPLTTIGLRLNHVALCKVMYHEHAFGDARLTWDTIDTPGTVAGTLAVLDNGQSLLAADVRALRDADLAAPVSTNWGELWPTWKILWEMIAHDLQHGAEIGALRDLYRLRADPS